MATDPPVDDRPVLFRPPTFARHDAAARYVEGRVRTRAPRTTATRFPGVIPGAWGLLASGNSISAASGMTLGSGDVNLCDRSGVDSGVTVTAYNAGPAITASSGDKIVPMEWTGGDWSVCECVTGPTCYVPIVMHGCGTAGGLVLTWGVDVQVKSGSTVLFSGTTDGTGTLLVPVGGSGIAPGTYTVVATDGRGTPRWNSQSYTFLNFSCPPTTKNLQMTSPLAAYICLNCCADPVKRVMTFTSTKFGTWTGDWVSTLNDGFSGPACGGCAGGYKIVPGFISSSFPCTAAISVFYNAGTGCPQTYPGASCGLIYYNTSVSMTCPPSFSWSGSSSMASMTGCLDKVMGCGTYPWTDTMTATE